MSALTKVFVVLLVVLSLLLAAASVTFLNTIPSYNTEIEGLNAALTAARTATNQAQATAAAQTQGLQNQLNEVTAQLTDAQQQITSLRTDLDNAEAEQAALQTQLASAQSTAAISSRALAANQAILNQLQDQIGTLRTESNTALTEAAQLQRRLTQAENELLYAERYLRNAQEQGTEQQSRIDQLERLVTSLGGTLDSLESVTPNVNGVIVDRTTIGSGQAGRPYATISVGREDDVRPGNEFAVFQQGSGEFLGFIRIEVVDDSEAFGLLTGPNVGQIASGDTIRTST